MSCSYQKEEGRITDLFESEGTFKAIWPNSPAMNRDTDSQTRLLSCGKAFRPAAPIVLYSVHRKVTVRGHSYIPSSSDSLSQEWHLKNSNHSCPARVHTKVGSFKHLRSIQCSPSHGSYNTPGAPPQGRSLESLQGGKQSPCSKGNTAQIQNCPLELHKKLPLLHHLGQAGSTCRHKKDLGATSGLQAHKEIPQSSALPVASQGKSSPCKCFH